MTRRPGPAATALVGTTLAGHPVLAVGDRAVHRAVLDWLTAEVGSFAASALLCGPLDERAEAATRAQHLRLTKPPGSLGRLEHVAAQLAGIAATSPPPLPRPAAVAVFAGDHGVHAQGVSPWPQEVTAQMVGNLLAGGAAINVLARQVGAEVVVIDVGAAATFEPHPGLTDAKVRRGTADLTVGPAMTVEEALQALDVGATAAAGLVEAGAACLVTGDMGIANTTPSAALIASLTELPAASVTGRGTGIDDAWLTRKIALVAAAAARARYNHGEDPLAVLAEVGGLEHAALAGFLVGRGGPPGAGGGGRGDRGVGPAGGQPAGPRRRALRDRGPPLGRARLGRGARRPRPGPAHRPRPAPGRGHRGGPGPPAGGGGGPGGARDGHLRRGRGERQDLTPPPENSRQDLTPPPENSRQDLMPPPDKGRR